MLTNLNIANAVATVAANIDGGFTTQDNLFLATGYTNGSAIFNLGSPAVIDAFTGTGSIAYDTANNHFYAADGASFSFVLNGANVAVVAQGNTGGTLDLNGGA